MKMKCTSKVMMENKMMVLKINLREDSYVLGKRKKEKEMNKDKRIHFVEEYFLKVLSLLNRLQPLKLRKTASQLCKNS